MLRKIMLSSLLLMVIASSAFAVAIPFKIDLGSLGLTTGAYDADAQTSLMSQISFVQTSEILQNVDTTTGTLTSFNEDGIGYATSFTPIVSGGFDSEGLATGDVNNPGLFEMTFQFTGLQGNVVNFVNDTIFFDFANIGSISIWVDQLDYLNTTGDAGTDHDAINTLDPDYLNTYAGFGDGIKIAELDVLSGHGTLNVNDGKGDTHLVLDFVDNANYYGIWLDEFGNDLVKLSAQLPIYFETTDTTQKSFESYPALSQPAQSYTFLTAGNGGMEPNVVPEPSTFLLLGGGLLGLGFYARRKK